MFEVYRYAPRRRFGCHLPVVGFGRVCEVRSPQRQTFENVFLIYKTARSPVAGLTSDGAKIIIIVEETKKNDEKSDLEVESSEGRQKK